MYIYIIYVLVSFQWSWLRGPPSTTAVRLSMALPSGMFIIDESELRYGKLLGKGGFAEVYQVRVELNLYICVCVYILYVCVCVCEGVKYEYICKNYMYL